MVGPGPKWMVCAPPFPPPHGSWAAQRTHGRTRPQVDGVCNPPFPHPTVAGPHAWIPDPDPAAGPRPSTPSHQDDGMPHCRDPCQAKGMQGFSSAAAAYDVVVRLDETRRPVAKLAVLVLLLNADARQRQQGRGALAGRNRGQLGAVCVPTEMNRA